MTNFAAYLLLKRNSRKKIKNIVDCGDNLQALLILLPSFEYPDWDYKTVGEFLRVTCPKFISEGRNADRKAKEQVMRDCGLVKVRGAVTGKIYWE